ncbi:MAG: hypothetical protein QXU11_08765 [Thermoproteota archaeon]
MVGRAWRGLLLTLFSSTVFSLLLLLGLNPLHNRLSASPAPSSYSWTGLQTSTITITYFVEERIWCSGTGYLHITANAPGKHSDAKQATAVVTVPQGVSAGVYVCGDDRNPVPNGWTVEEKYLRLEVDGNRVYELERVLVGTLLF